MAIDSVSALSPITQYSRIQQNRPVETAQPSQQAMAPSAAQTSAPGTVQMASMSASMAQRGTQTSAPSAASMAGSAATLAGPETMGNWNWAVAQPGVNATPGETEGSIQSASTQIAQAYGNGQTSPADIRNATEAYRNQSSARDQAAQQQQGNGTRTLDIFA